MNESIFKIISTIIGIMLTIISTLILARLSYIQDVMVELQEFKTAQQIKNERTSGELKALEKYDNDLLEQIKELKSKGQHK